MIRRAAAWVRYEIGRAMSLPCSVKGQAPVVLSSQDTPGEKGRLLLSRTPSALLGSRMIGVDGCDAYIYLSLLG